MMHGDARIITQKKIANHGASKQDGASKTLKLVPNITYLSVFCLLVCLLLILLPPFIVLRVRFGLGVIPASDCYGKTYAVSLPLEASMLFLEHV